MKQEKIGKFIARLRKENNLTQEQLANQIGVSFKTVSKWETGVSVPDVEMIEVLSNILGVTISEMLSGEKEEKEFKRKKLTGTRKKCQKKKLGTFLLISFLSVCLIFVLISFHNNYHNCYIYSLSSENNLYVLNGFLVSTPEKEVLQIHSVELSPLAREDDIEIYDYSYSIWTDENTSIITIGEIEEYSYENQSQSTTLKQLLNEIKIDITENTNYDEILGREIYKRDFKLVISYLTQNLETKTIEIPIHKEKIYINNKLLYHGGLTF